MLRSLIGRLFSISTEKAAQDARPRQRDDESRNEKSRAAGQEALADSWTDEEADLGDEENDWYEYDDEIASAVAFAAQCDEDEAALAAELQEAHEDAEHWEDWAAVAEREDDASYQWDQEEEEEY